jgi:uncharacterized protein (DUF1697 family)
MDAFIALLRAVNVGGTGKLPMQDLKSLCEKAGFIKVQTHIASGNVLFKSEKTESQVKRVLETSLENYAGKPVGVMVRTPHEMTEILARNPFKKTAPNHTLVIFLDDQPAPDTLDGIRGKKDEEIQLGKREIYVSYGDGMGTSKLKIPAAKSGTARNINTITKLIELAVDLF